MFVISVSRGVNQAWLGKTKVVKAYFNTIDNNSVHRREQGGYSSGLKRKSGFSLVKSCFLDRCKSEEFFSSCRKGGEVWKC